MMLDLYQRSISGQGDFSLELESGKLFLDEIVRKVPGRRLVAKGTWQTKLVYAKIFIGKNHELYAARDKNGIQLLKASEIDTAELLYSGKFLDASVLIIKAVQDGLSAEEVYKKSDQNSRFFLAKQLMRVLAQHHNAGIIQTDIYLKNFLVTPLKILTLDGDGIRDIPYNTASKAQQNLCILLSKFDVLDLESWLPELTETYCQHRHQRIALNINKIKVTIHRIRRLVANSYAEKKVFRTCSDVRVSRKNHFLALATNFLSLDLPRNAEGYDDLLSKSHLLKRGNTCTVGKIRIAGVEIAIKRYNIKSKLHFLSRMLRPSRAAISWENAHRLIILDIATPAPIAIFETRYCGLRGQAYFVSEFLDAPDIASFLEYVSDQSVIGQAANEMAHLLYRLYLLWISHGDFKASNIKWADERPVMIDLDSMRQHSRQSSARKAHIRDLKRFMQNWKDDTTLYNAFLQALKAVYADHEILRQAGLLIED